MPIPAYLLALVYFFLAVLSVVMLIGLRGKKTRMLLAWMLFFLLGVFPEAGMVLFMAVYYWVRDQLGIECSIETHRSAKLTSLIIHTERRHVRDRGARPVAAQGTRHGN